MPRPLKTMELLVLAVLTDGPLHGYGLTRELEDRTDGALRVRPGNLYRVLDRLRHQGLLGEVEPPAAPLQGAERGRGFELTPAGRARLDAETTLLSRALARSPEVRAVLTRELESTP